MLNHLIDEAMELLLEDNFSRDIVEISYVSWLLNIIYYN